MQKFRREYVTVYNVASQWHRLTPHIQIMSPLRNDLQFKARKEEEAQDLLKRYKEHLAKAREKLL